jgi:hypothetical protein
MLGLSLQCDEYAHKHLTVIRQAIWTATMSPTIYPPAA